MSVDEYRVYGEVWIGCVYGCFRYFRSDSKKKHSEKPSEE